MLHFSRFCRPIHMGRIVPEIDPNLAEQIVKNTVNPKKLTTRRNLGFTELPAQLEFAAQARLSKVTSSKYRQEAKELIEVLYKQKLPDDINTVEQKKADIKTTLEIRDKIPKRTDHAPDQFQLHEDIDIAARELSELIKGTLEDRRRDWHYYEYDEYSSDLYMGVRLAPNYACIKRVMNEIRDLAPDFKPNSVLDFGSGMGTTIWAVNETWPQTVGEFMNIDLSKDQQYLCEFLLRGGKESGEPLPNVFHRQYLPTSTKVKYDMVVSAFSMLDLPNAELRSHTIENLWNKTNDILVIIERGNKGGFTIVNEARHQVLDLCGHDVTRRVVFSCQKAPVNQLEIPNAHVVAPCAHEFLCPRQSMSSKRGADLCRFKVFFTPMELGSKRPGLAPEEFSYVVLRKRPHPSYLGDPQPRWPRVIDKRKRGSGQVIHKLCCPNGSLAETTITKKYGKPTFEVAKSCDWGDILPIRVKDSYAKKTSFIDEKTPSNEDKTP